jgi:hypothetical protein
VIFYFRLAFKVKIAGSATGCVYKLTKSGSRGPFSEATNCRNGK